MKTQNNYYEANMTQATDADVREIRTEIEANTNAIGDLTALTAILVKDLFPILPPKLSRM